MALKHSIELEGVETLGDWVDRGAAEDAAAAAARQVMRRKGLPQGANLIGAHKDARDAAEAELARQLEAAGLGGGGTIGT